MSDTTIKNDMNTQWVIDGDDTIWTLKKKAEISVHNTAIDVLATSEGNELRIEGDVSANAPLVSRGIAVAGANTTVQVGDESEISARTGIVNTATDFRLVNRGEIDGSKFGVSTEQAAVIRNSGEISGETAIQAIGGTRIVNGAAGEISGEAMAIEVSMDHTSTIINRGLIASDDVAISVNSTGENHLRNLGTIIGHVVFANGIDVIDTRKGTVDGDIYGGWGADVYRIGDSDTSIIELAGQGSERVEAWASYDLADNIENLVLKGKADLDGSGNADNNRLGGNSGDNRLSGGAGDDFLNGGAGDDLLIGDAGNDLFVFYRGGDRDTISGFEQGSDVIQVVFEDEDINEFADIQGNISQHGADVWISMGQGDRLILEDTDIADVDESDFTFDYISVA